MTPGSSRRQCRTQTTNYTLTPSGSRLSGTRLGGSSVEGCRLRLLSPCTSRRGGTGEVGGGSVSSSGDNVPSSHSPRMGSESSSDNHHTAQSPHSTASHSNRHTTLSMHSTVTSQYNPTQQNTITVQHNHFTTQSPHNTVLHNTITAHHNHCMTQSLNNTVTAQHNHNTSFTQISPYYLNGRQQRQIPPPPSNYPSSH